MAPCMSEGTQCAFHELLDYAGRLDHLGENIPENEVHTAAAMLISALFADAMGREMMPSLYPQPESDAAATLREAISSRALAAIWLARRSPARAAHARDSALAVRPPGADFPLQFGTRPCFFAHSSSRQLSASLAMPLVACTRSNPRPLRRTARRRLRRARSRSTKRCASPRRRARTCRSRERASIERAVSRCRHAVNICRSSAARCSTRARSQSQFSALQTTQPTPGPDVPPAPTRDTTTFFQPCTRYLAPAGASEAERLAALETFSRCSSGGSGGIDFTKVGFGSKNQYQLGLTGSVNLFTGGRVSAQNAAAAAGRRSADIELTAQRAQLRLDVAQAYYDAALADRLVAIADSSLRADRRSAASDVTCPTGRQSIGVRAPARARDARQPGAGAAAGEDDRASSATCDSSSC